MAIPDKDTYVPRNSVSRRIHELGKEALAKEVSNLLDAEDKSAEQKVDEVRKLVKSLIPEAAER